MTERINHAQETVIQDYLDSLLTEPAKATSVSDTTARLLEKASEHLVDVPLAEPPHGYEDLSNSPGIEAEQDVAAVEIELPAEQDEADTHPVPSLDTTEVPASAALALKDQLEERFQALFFEVAGLTLAVPLITLGGIHQLEKIGPLFGKPAWFKGVMLHREQKINVVDTALWVMPEKYDQNLSETLNYQYLIMLGDSLWGLASDKLVNTVTLSKDEVKWRGANSRRPWLAGTVKEKMCALVDVNQLILMLNNGLGSQD